MTNPTTPLPVQEPAGAVEAIMALAAKFAESYAKVYFATQCGMTNTRAGEDAEAAREALRSALASLQPVTQVWRSICDSEWVNIVNAPIVQEQGTDSHAAVCEAFKLIEAKLRELNEFRSAAPQEAVERQPLTADEVIAEWSRPCYPGDIHIASAFEAGVRYAERMHGIGPATQEKP